MQKWPEEAVTIVMYHAVDTRRHQYATHPHAFRRQIELIAERYRVVPLRSLERRTDDSERGRRRVVLTFDDGFRDFLDVPYPLLASLRLPCTVFVPTGFIGGANAWDAAKGCGQRQIMSAGELGAIARAGLVELGSHTIDHVRMAPLSPREMRRQALDSKRTLESLTGVEVRSFAYPYGQLGDFSGESARVLAAAGYTIGVTTHWGTRLTRSALLALRRIHFRDSDDASTIQSKIEGGHDWIAFKERAGLARRLVTAYRWPAARREPSLRS